MSALTFPQAPMPPAFQASMPTLSGPRRVVQEKARPTGAMACSSALPPPLRTPPPCCVIFPPQSVQRKTESREMAQRLIRRRGSHGSRLPLAYDLWDLPFSRFPPASAQLDLYRSNDVQRNALAIRVAKYKEEQAKAQEIEESLIVKNIAKMKMLRPGARANDAPSRVCAQGPPAAVAEGDGTAPAAALRLPRRVSVSARARPAGWHGDAVKERAKLNKEREERVRCRGWHRTPTCPPSPPQNQASPRLYPPTPRARQVAATKAYLDAEYQRQLEMVEGKREFLRKLGMEARQHQKALFTQHTWATIIAMGIRLQARAGGAASQLPCGATHVACSLAPRLG